MAAAYYIISLTYVLYASFERRGGAERRICLFVPRVHVESGVMALML